VNRSEIANLVMESLGEILSERYAEEEFEVPPVDESTYLIGRRAVLDSLGLVTMIVNIEQKLSDGNGISVTIADERAMSQEKSPFRTVQTLSDYVSLLVDEEIRNDKF
jgi:acyl carrier protein